MRTLTDTDADDVLKEYERLRAREYVAMTAAPDFPFYDVLDDAVKRMHEGHTIYQKFTCAKCAQRLTVETPNYFFKTGTCDRCGAVTDIEKRGCNFLVVMHDADRTKIRATAGR
jgi:hypothetical protein